MVQVTQSLVHAIFEAVMKTVCWEFTNLCLRGDMHRFGDVEGHKSLNEHDPCCAWHLRTNAHAHHKGDAVSQITLNSDKCQNTLWCVFRMCVFLGGPGRGAQLFVAA